jgi:Holliday junction resolvase
MESHNHAALKVKGVQYLYEKGCHYVATEMQVGKYIYDVIGSDGNRVFIIEAKATHKDFLKDCHTVEEIKANVDEYKKLLVDTGDIDYKKKMEKEREKSYKFYNPAIFRLCTQSYIIAPDNEVDESEMPEGWGLLNYYLTSVVKVDPRRIEDSFAKRVIFDIAKRNSKLFMEKLGVEFGKNIIWPDIGLI